MLRVLIDRFWAIYLRRQLERLRAARPREEWMTERSDGHGKALCRTQKTYERQ